MILITLKAVLLVLKNDLAIDDVAATRWMT